jgi:tRNA threonylcarbamoyladenosine biosynthesis protein TsaE
MVEEFLKSPYCIAVEWPENVLEWLPEGTFHLYLEDKGQGKRAIRLA